MFKVASFIYFIYKFLYRDFLFMLLKNKKNEIFHLDNKEEKKTI